MVRLENDLLRWLDSTQLTDVPGNYQIFRNIGQLPDRGQEGWVFTQEWDCKRVRIADLDGDDKCDIIHLAKNGVVEHWYKTHYENGQWRFEEEFGEIRGLEIALILLTDLGVPPTADQ
jgi:hypothetical protein